MNKINFILDNMPNMYNKEKESNVYKVLSPIANQLDNLIKEMEKVKEGKFIDYAIGEELDKIAKILNMKRFLNESDNNFRSRVKIKVKSFIGGGTKQAISEVVKTYLGVEPQIFEHYLPDEGHALFNNGVLNGLEITAGTGLTVNFSTGTWYYNGINYYKVGGIRDSLSANTTNYITAGTTRIIYSRTSPILNDGEILLATVVTNASSVTSITDNRFILNPEEHYITNTASITVQIPYSFDTSNISIEDVKDILRNTKAAGIALLIKIMETYNDSLTISDNINPYFLVGFSGIGGSNFLGGV
jgi:hypothetical protein